MAQAIFDKQGLSEASPVRNENNTTRRIGSLLTSTSRVEAPFIKVKIGDYTFGVYEERGHGTNSSGFYRNISTKYPNYIQSLDVKKINGTLNQYTINIKYPVTANSDPNFFEKLFSRISNTRLISIDYGDFMVPDYIYREEEAIVTDIKTQFDIKSSVIDYTISATSTATLSLSGCYNFGGIDAKPSDEIKRILRQNTNYHLLDVFTGMKDEKLVEQEGFIAGDDKVVHIPTCTNISALNYISILVSYMSSTGTSSESTIKPSVYSLTTYEDTSGVYGGPYFKVQKIQTSENVLTSLCTYEIDIGFPTANIVTNFTLKNNDNWSVLFDYNESLDNSDYVKRINSKGEIEYEYSPLITGSKYDVTEADKSWWTKMTNFPIQASITLKGLLKPAILMQYVKLNIWFFGNRHMASGYYLITSQEDRISISGGYTTTLELLRVSSIGSSAGGIAGGGIAGGGGRSW